jgi:hypothetical protein
MVPAAAAYPEVAPVEELSQRYVKLQFPPSGVEPPIAAGEDPSHTLWLLLIVFCVMMGFTTMVTG